jgi:DNA-binding CsgD family transcriptional regulator
VQPLLEHAYACAGEPAADVGALRGVGLTAREADVAALVGQGATNAQIARSLHLSEATVKTHLSHAYAKLGVRTRTELAVLVRDRRRRFDRTSVRPVTTFG